MTLTEIKKEIAVRTGVPPSVIAYILDTQEDIISECVLRRETCYIGKVFTIRSRFRNYSVIGKNGARAIVNRLTVSVKPRAPFRRRMSNGEVRSTD